MASALTYLREATNIPSGANDSAAGNTRLEFVAWLGVHRHMR